MYSRSICSKGWGRGTLEGKRRNTKAPVSPVRWGNGEWDFGVLDGVIWSEDWGTFREAIFSQFLSALLYDGGVLSDSQVDIDLIELGSVGCLHYIATPAAYNSFQICQLI
ncbi:unnamed protein product [Moneuplotes crassus]|uniref:Uncharacterized protein n=1 Tax=Euplotes crassus TaxID=5936 RepID=A0AAD1Y133_EUPCR|nr:unnamed protein product [Moneuplotes crassus]